MVSREISVNLTFSHCGNIHGKNTYFQGILAVGVKPNLITHVTPHHAKTMQPVLEVTAFMNAIVYMVTMAAIVRRILMSVLQIHV